MSTDDPDQTQSSRYYWPPKGLIAALLFSTLVCLALWYAFREPSCSATALFRVNSQKWSLWDGDGGPMEAREFEILQRTQLALLKSYFVLQAAVRNPGIASLPILAGKVDPVSWLAENIEAEFPGGSGVLAIKLRGDQIYESDLQKLVDAVATAYEHEVVADEKGYRLKVRDAMARALTKLEEELKSEMEVLLAIKADIGKEESVGVNLRQQEVDTLSELTREMKRKLAIIDLNAEAPAEMSPIQKIQPAVITCE